MKDDSTARRILYVAWLTPFSVCLLAAYVYALALVIGLPVVAIIDLLKRLFG